MEYFDHFFYGALAIVLAPKRGGGGEAADPPALPLPYSALPYSCMNA